MPRPLVHAVPLLAVALAGCHFDATPQYLVGDLRILAIRSTVNNTMGDPISLADPDMGMAITLEALVANPQNLAPVTLTWKACLPLPDEAVSPCLDANALRDPERLSGPGVIDLGTGSRVSATVPMDVAPYLAALIQRAQANAELACGLYAELPVLLIATAGPQRQVAAKTVRIAPFREVAGTSLENAYLVVRNPALQEIATNPLDPEACSGGAPVLRACQDPSDCGGAACVGAEDGAGHCADRLLPVAQTLCARPLDGSQGTYFQCQADGTRIEYWEELSFQWYTTGGILAERDSRTPFDPSGNRTTSSVDFTPPEGPFTLWAIIRNGRGGVGWLVRDYP
jgi:hypothetical protein